MEQYRITEHPILPIPEFEAITFYWNKQPLTARKNEMISSALIANGISVFGHHHKDGSAQGIFCANGQCAKCAVIANGIAVKSCMTAVAENMVVESAEGLPHLPEDSAPLEFEPIETIETEVLIIGGGPAGLSAAIQLGEHGIKTLLIDDKHEPGGKLVLQTHKFFGSEEDSNAGTRGSEIGKLLAAEVAKLPSVEIWLNSTALFVFSDKKVGILKDGQYKLVIPRRILNAAGAREKFLRFPGNHLAGIYGAGAFQTLVNRDLVKPTKRLFIIGGGNVGLIAGYHALQAGIEVVGLAEAMPMCGGYKVHADKLQRLGVPIYTSHSVLCANGGETVESITITELDRNFKPVPGTEQSFLCDTILIAVGLDPLNEFTQEAEVAGLPVYAAGDAFEIAEASSAMFNGKIAGLKIAKDVINSNEIIPDDWYQKAEILKSHPGEIRPYQDLSDAEGVFPVIHCLQEIPCNPCTTVCPTNAIVIDDEPLMGNPLYKGSCIGCNKCLLICPGLAVTLVDLRKDREFPTVTLPYEVYNYPVKIRDKIHLTDIEGNELGAHEVTGLIHHKNKKTQLIKVKVPNAIAKLAASFRIQSSDVAKPMQNPVLPYRLLLRSPKFPTSCLSPESNVGILNSATGRLCEAFDDAMICLCERVSVKQVRELARAGITDLNQIKAVTRAGMGPCGAKTCEVLIKNIFREEGIPIENVVPNTKRPIFVEVPLAKFPGVKPVPVK